MPADLTLDAVGPAAVTYGLECPEHPDARRHGLTQAHATNAVAKHNRDNHEDGPTADLVNISAACLVLLEEVAPAAKPSPGQALHAIGARPVAQFALEALTGLTGEAAIQQAETWAEALPPIVAHVAPF